MGYLKPAPWAVHGKVPLGIAVSRKLHIPVSLREFWHGCRCPWNVYRATATRTPGDLFRGFIKVVPRTSCHGNPSIFCFLGDLILEMVVDRVIDGLPRHSRTPGISQSEPSTVLEIIARVEHEGVPNHENVYTWSALSIVRRQAVDLPSGGSVSRLETHGFGFAADLLSSTK